MLQDEEFHHKGPVHLLAHRTARRLGLRFYDMYYVERHLGRSVEAAEAGLPLEFAIAGDTDFAEILAGREARQRPRLEHLYASGRTLCYVARSEGRLAGHSWLKRGLMDITGLDAIELPIREMPPDTGLTHDAFVWPEFRGHHVFRALLRHVMVDQRSAGLRRICNLIDPANGPSLKVHLFFGARLRRVRYLKLPGSGLRVVGRNFEIGAVDPPR